MIFGLKNSMAVSRKLWISAFHSSTGVTPVRLSLGASAGKEHQRFDKCRKMPAEGGETEIIHE
jgi:hypothetical protein